MAGDTSPVTLDMSKSVPISVAAPSSAPSSSTIDSDTIGRMAAIYDLDPDIINRQIQQESGGNPTAVSKKGAIGLMQLMPDTATRLGVTDPYNPIQNLDGGLREMSRLLGKYDGDYSKALAAYNAGDHQVDSAGGIPDIKETKDYVNAILKGTKYEGQLPSQQPSSPAVKLDMSKSVSISQPKPSLMESDVYPALIGSVKGVATGLGIPDTSNPISDWGRAINEQVNRIYETPWGQGGPVWGVLSTAGHGLVSSGESTYYSISAMIDAAKNNDVEGFYKAAGTGITSLMLLKSMVNPDTEPMTLGMKKGGLAASIERIANRIPVSARPIQKVYEDVANNFKDDIAGNISNASGIKADPEDLVGSLNKGADSIHELSQKAYEPFDDYIRANNAAFVNQTVQRLINLDPEIVKQIPAKLFQDHPVNALKQVGDALYRKGSGLINSGQGIAAKQYFDFYDDINNTLDGMIRSMPPNIQATYQLGQKLYNKQAAMRDIAEIFDKNISGLPPGSQPTGLAKFPQQISAISLVDALKDEPRLRQAFGPDVADAIIQHSHRLALTQALKGGSSNAANVVGMMYGTSLLARIFTGAGLSTVPVELSGVYALSKVLSNPPSLPYYANMLKATSTTAQNYWAKKAIDSAMVDHSASQLSPSDIKFLGDIHGSIPDPLRGDIGEAIQQYGH